MQEQGPGTSKYIPHILQVLLLPVYVKQESAEEVKDVHVSFLNFQTVVGF